MKTKKIIADSMPLALKMVRQQLGENAIIVNTRTVKKGGVLGIFGKLKYEVTAYSVEKDSEQRTEPRYILERKEKAERKAPENVPMGQPKVENKNGGGSGAQKKPKKLYGYHAQTAPANVTANRSATSDGTSSQERINQSSVEPVEASMEMSSFQPFVPAQQAQPQETVVNEETSSVEKGGESLPKTEVKDDAVLNELQHMRKMLMTFMMNEKQGQALPTAVAKWINRLKKQGIHEDLVEWILDDLLNQLESWEDADDEVVLSAIRKILIDMLEKRIPKTNNINEGVRMINVVGPTGVGKTTTIAKLATEQVLKQKRRVAMITTDVYRIAAVEQLKTYAGILNVPFEVVRSAEELVRVVENLKYYDLIYMDTTGRNYKELQYRESIASYLGQPFESDNYLVLSLITKFEDMEILLDEFLESPIKKIIFTKYDETTSFGSIFNIAYKYPYELAYITNGQSVPEDITPMDVSMVVSSLLGEEK